MKRTLTIFTMIGLCVLLAASIFMPTFAQRRRGQAPRQGAPQGNNNGSYVVGKNRFTTQVNGDTREYYVHVPKSYNKSTPIPVVFMLHGSSGDGEKFYNISGWKELGEVENILTVYPSSWHYCIIEDGERKNTTKWNVYPGTFEYCSGQTPRDDIKFLNQVIDELEQKFNVNQKMIYMVGFSNGGQMTGRVGVEMSNRVAAVVEADGTFGAGNTYTPQRLLPNLLQLGTDDDRFIPKVFGGAPAPMNFDELFAKSPAMRGIIGTYITTYKLNPKYTTGGDPNKIIWADYKGVSGNPNNVFRFALIKGMTHLYPNGKNFPVPGAELNWKWLKQFKLP